MGVHSALPAPRSPTCHGSPSAPHPALLAQVDAEYDVSGKAAEAAKTAAEGARRVNDAAEELESRWQIRRRMRNAFADLKRTTPQVGLQQGREPPVQSAAHSDVNGADAAQAVSWALPAVLFSGVSGCP